MSELDSSEVWAQAHDRLRSLESAHRHRADEICDIPEGKIGPHRVVEEKALINFSSNDYLDLAHHPDVKQGAVKAIERYGAGCMSSRLVCGTLPIHRELESAIASFKNTESSLVFSSGYLAGVGAIQALSLRADNSRVPIVFDRLVHASLIDGATQDRRNWRSFPHNNLSSLELVLDQIELKEWPSAIVVTEGVFSMDGDYAPVNRMSEICKKHKALLLVDDAHGTGTVGDRGEGLLGMSGLAGEPYIVHVGTLSKALGSQGGFVAGPKVLRDLLVNSARTFIFDTGLNPGAAGAAIAALEIVIAEPDRVKKMQSNARLFRKLLNRIGCDYDHPSPIVPVMLRTEEAAGKASHTLREKGFMVAAIRPPTVPPGTSRLRVTISSAHAEEDIRHLAQAISQLDAG